MPHETVAQAVDVLLEVLGALGVPGTSLARRAVGGVESLRRSQAARQHLEGLLQEAEEDFVHQARQQGLETVAQWVASLPVQNLPTFRQALEGLRTHWDERALTERLAQEFARLPGVPTEQQARALALYLACLRARLLADENLRPMVVALSTLRTEAGVERLLEAVDALYGAVNRLLGLPADLVAWPVQTLSEIAELRADLLLPAYRLVPYTGRAFQETRADLLDWARGLEAARPPVGLRTYIGPGGAGKTRLLIEVGQALREEGWWVGFLRAGRLKQENARILGTDARPTLLIVDYVANRDKEVRDPAARSGPRLRGARRPPGGRPAGAHLSRLVAGGPPYLHRPRIRGLARLPGPRHGGEGAPASARPGPGRPADALPDRAGAVCENSPGRRPSSPRLRRPAGGAPLRAAPGPAGGSGGAGGAPHRPRAGPGVYLEPGAGGLETPPGAPLPEPAGGPPEPRRGGGGGPGRPGHPGPGLCRTRQRRRPSWRPTNLASGPSPA
jgi:hypothetical protein